LFNFLKKTEEKTEKLAEAAGATIAPEEAEGWTKLTGDKDRSLSSLTQERMQELAVFLWKTNPLANRIIELPLVYLLAEGVRMNVPDEQAQAWLDEFWEDPINQMNIKLPKKVREMAIFGEQCWPVFKNPTNGAVRLGYLDPSRIKKVITDPDNAEQPIGIQTKGIFPKKYRVIINGPESVFGEAAQKLRRSFKNGECFYFNINALSASSRGQSDLLALMDWLDLYDKALFGEVERWDSLRAFIWDVSLRGATEETVKKRAAEIDVPESGGVRVHNDGETWQAVAPDLQAANGAENARLFRNHIMGGATLPEHWYGGGGDVNRSTAGEMGEPTFKTFKFKQTEWKHILENVCFYAILSRAGAVGMKIDNIKDLKPSAVFPELTHRDTSVYAAALQQAVVAVGIAVEKKLMTEETAVLTITAFLGRIGLEIDAREELEKARNEARREEAADIYGGEGAADEWE
jgi:hypothetical protein